MAAPMVFPIPTIDFSPFMVEEGCIIGKAPTEAQMLVAVQIDHCIRRHGFLYLDHFGIEEEELNATFEVAKELFWREECEHEELAPFVPNINMGHSALGQVHNSFERPADIRENLILKSPRWHDNDLCGAPSGFGPAANLFWQKLEKASQRLLIACAVAMGLTSEESELFARKHVLMDDAAMGFDHYPPCHFQEGITDGRTGKGAIRCGEAADFGTLTFLFPDKTSGLQIQKAKEGAASAPSAGVKAGSSGWIDVPPRHGTCAVILIGALMARWTNDRWRATAHRVVVPNAEAAANHQYSISYCVSPDVGSVISTDSYFLRKKEISRYEPISADQHYLSKLMVNQINEQKLQTSSNAVFGFGGS
eukprot:TRINITY_DN13869_c0_g1_i2.p1 TRINITY_DN13869_c0_g1~~TRINITY_DN13869_c0_g1_i2.p1  ORF type:complete len:364 (-),score=66.06 TRINITY_DN13869_c0_g1_i2:223-1314(-)